MDMKHGKVYTLLKTLAFPLAEWIWTLEPGFPCDAATGGKARIRAFSFAPALSLFALAFLRATALFFSFALASVKAQKNAAAHL